MTPDSNLCVLQPNVLHHAEVKRLAARALSVLATRPERANDGIKHHLNALCDAFVSAEEEPRHAAMLRILQEGIAPRDVVAHIIPATARLLGERWFADELSFAEVTIGAARLQEAVRAMVARDPVTYTEPLGTVLLILPRPEQHSLGIFVAADRFRRLGYDVELSVEEQIAAIVDRVVRRNFAMVGMSASSRRTVVFVKELIDTLRRQVPRNVPVVIGGSAVDMGLDGIRATGADHVALDPKDALTLCGLPVLQTPKPERTPAN